MHYSYAVTTTDILQERYFYQLEILLQDFHFLSLALVTPRIGSRLRTLINLSGGLSTFSLPVMQHIGTLYHCRTHHYLTLKNSNNLAHGVPRSSLVLFPRPLGRLRRVLVWYYKVIVTVRGSN